MFLSVFRFLVEKRIMIVYFGRRREKREEKKFLKWLKEQSGKKCPKNICGKNNLKKKYSFFFVAMDLFGFVHN